MCKFSRIGEPQFVHWVFAFLVTVLLAAPAASQDSPTHKPGPAEVVKKFYALCEEGKPDEADKLLTVSPSESIIFTQKVGNWPAIVHEHKIVLIRIVSETIDKNQAEVVAVLQEAGIWRPYMHFVYKLFGEWKIQGHFPADSQLCKDDPRSCHIIEPPPPRIDTLGTATLDYKYRPQSKRINDWNRY